MDVEFLICISRDNIKENKEGYNLLSWKKPVEKFDGRKDSNKPKFNVKC